MLTSKVSSSKTSCVQLVRLHEFSYIVHSSLKLQLENNQSTSNQITRMAPRKYCFVIQQFRFLCQDCRLCIISSRPIAPSLLRKSGPFRLSHFFCTFQLIYYNFRLFFFHVRIFCTPPQFTTPTECSFSCPIRFHPYYYLTKNNRNPLLQINYLLSGVPLATRNFLFTSPYYASARCKSNFEKNI